MKLVVPFTGRGPRREGRRRRRLRRRRPPPSPSDYFLLLEILPLVRESLLLVAGIAVVEEIVVEVAFRTVGSAAHFPQMNGAEATQSTRSAGTSAARRVERKQTRIALGPVGATRQRWICADL